VALGRQDAVTVLAIVLSRIYVRREPLDLALVLRTSPAPQRPRLGHPVSLLARARRAVSS
jgi:hypothetical protein